ncbi:mCG146305, partial [Mus musculus]
VESPGHYQMFQCQNQIKICKGNRDQIRCAYTSDCIQKHRPEQYAWCGVEGGARFDSNSSSRGSTTHFSTQSTNMNIYEETQLLELKAQRLFKSVQCCALRKSLPQQKLATYTPWQI